jgi:thiopeptide-type bacteriocin biosynthesis protein
MNPVTTVPFDFFVIRLPYKPISQLLTSLDRTDSNSSLVLLKTILAEQWMGDAIFLASPSLHKTWQSIGDHALDQHPDVVNSLWRYVFRAYTRATPYGLFSGMGLGQIQSVSQLSFGDLSWYTVTRPDCTVLEVLARSVERNPHYQPQLRYSLNNSLYQVAGEYRFSEFYTSTAEKKVLLESYSITDELKTLVTFLEQEKQATFGQLSTLFDPEDQENVFPFINELIRSGFLISNLALPVTGQEMAHYLLDQLAQLSPPPPEYKILKDVAQQSEGAFRALSDQLEKGIASIDESAVFISSTSLLHTNLFFKPDQLTISSSIVNTIAKQFVNLLPFLSFPQTSLLDRFAQRFYNRFERQEIDLLSALDGDVGVGFNNETLGSYSILTDLGFSEPVPLEPKLDPLVAFREMLYNRFLLSSKLEVEVTDQDLARYAAWGTPGNLPESWYIHGELYQYSPGKQSTVNRKESHAIRFALNAAVPNSASVILGRFCHDHAELRQAVKDLCAWEQSVNPEDMIAEIVHLPPHPDRAGNVVARPVLRSYEIPYITPSATGSAQTIPLSDILVSVTERGRILLRSKTTGKRIRPKLSSAHNPALGDEVYQFLVSLQYQEYDAIGWSWRALSQMAILPRLVYNNLIITPAQWTIQKEHVHDHTPITIDHLRDLYRLPRYVLLVESDNKLLLDLASSPAQTVLLTELNKHGQITLKEWLGETHNLWVTNQTDCYVSELVIPMKTVKTTSAQAMAYSIQKTAGLPAVCASAVRRYPPGSEWLYYKLYLHESMSDQILKDVLNPFWQTVLNRRWATQIFFIRYQDPENHLRIRIRAVAPRHIQNLMNEWLTRIQPFLNNQIVHKIQLDTYFPELERYTPDLMSACEAFFSADSAMVLTWLSQSANPLSEEERYKFGIRSGSALLMDLTENVADRVRISRALQTSFLSEQTDAKLIKQRLNAFYRIHNKDYFSDNPLLEILVNERSETTRLIRQQFKSHFSTTEKNPLFDAFIASLLHMSMNRIFAGQQRRHELVIYHFLARYYEAQYAKGKPF